ncbi:hypothetical protein NDU88_006075, partial [Pleurodeles waltl]
MLRTCAIGGWSVISYFILEKNPLRTFITSAQLLSRGGTPDFLTATYTRRWPIAIY